MAKSNFDYSLLEPEADQQGEPRFDHSKLEPAEEAEEIHYTPPPPRKGAAGIWEDVKEVPGHFMDYGYELGSQIPDFWKQLFTNPKRAAKNFALGAGETAEAIPNLLGELGPYFKKRGVPGLGAIPGFKIPDLGIEKAMDLGAQQPGDIVARNMFMFGGLPSLAKTLPVIAKVGTKIKSLKERGPLQKKVEQLQKIHEIKSELHGEQKQAYNALKDIFESEPDIATGTPSLLRRRAKEAEQGLGALREKQAAIPEHLRATEEPILEKPKAPSTMPLTLVEPERAEQLNLLKFEKPEVSKAPIEEAEAAHAGHQATTAEHEAAISQHLGEGLAHRRRVAQKLNPLLEQKQAEIGKGYDKYIAGLSNKNVTLTNARDAKVVMKELSDAFKKGGYKSPEVQKLSQEMENISKSKGDIMPADTFVSSYRTLRKMAQKVRSSAYGKSPDEFKAITAAADAMDADVARMEGIINKGLGEKNLEELHALNHRYATEVAPLFKNKFFQEMQAKGKAPKGMMEHLTNEPYIKSTNPNKVTGSQILNQMIKGDPDLLRHVIGEKFAKNPKELHAADEIAHEYIQHEPELQKMRNKHFESTQKEAQAKIAVERAKHEHKLRQEEANVAHEKQITEAKAKNKEAKVAADERTRLKKEATHKENERLREEHQQATDKAKAEHLKKKESFKLQEQMKGLDEKASKIRAAAEKIHERAKAKNITLKEKLSIEKELKTTKEQLANIEKDRNMLKKTRNRLLAVGATYLIGGSAVNKIASVMGPHTQS